MEQRNTVEFFADTFFPSEQGSSLVLGNCWRTQDYCRSWCMSGSSPHLFPIVSVGLYFQDNFPRIDERSKETPKASKMLTKLFPSKVNIQPPQVFSTHAKHRLRYAALCLSNFYASVGSFVKTFPRVMAGWGCACGMEASIGERPWDTKSEIE